MVAIVRSDTETDPAPHERRKLAPRASLGLALLCLALLGASGPCMRGPINASPQLRWWLFSNFAAGKICAEMTKRGVGLRMQDRGAAVGRFFPNQCSVDVNSSAQTIAVSFAGTGYAYMPLTKRVGFSVTATVEYRPDFYMGEEDIYVWGKVNRIVNAPSFRLGFVEGALADVATAVGPVGALANMFGNQIVTGELTQGFTAVRNTDRGDDFSLGIIMPPAKPHHPFDVSQSEFYTYANETTEVRGNQMDFLGPFEIVDSGQFLLMKYVLEGPAVDAMVVDKGIGDGWRDAYQTGRPIAPVPGPILAGAPIHPGQSQVPYRLAPGQYYVVIDNSPYVGMVAPPLSLLSPIADPVARLSYVAQLAE
jgi:hypothetical protein